MGFARKIMATVLLACGAETFVNAQCFDAALAEHVLMPDTGLGGVRFGGGTMSWPVTADGDVIAISDWEGAPVGNAAVYLYRHVGTSWQLEQTIFSDDPNAATYFGRLIDLDGNTLAIGEAFYQIPNSGPPLADGRLHVYEHDGQSWQLKTHLGPVDYGDNGFFTQFYCMALDGDWLFAGKTDDACPDNNNVCWNDLFIYKRVNGTWQTTPHQVVEDVEPYWLRLDGNTATWVGGCLELQGDTWVTTTNCPTLNGVHPEEMRDGVAVVGTGDVFRRINGTWTFDTNFPNTVHVSDQQRILVDEPGQWTVYAHDGNNWAPTGEAMLFPQPLNKLASSGSFAVGSVGGNAGYALACDLGDALGQVPSLDPEQVIDNPTPEDNDFFGTCVAMGEDYAAIGISGESVAQTPAGSALVLKRVGETWVQDTVLMVPIQGFSYLGETIDVTGSGEETVIVLGGGGYCDPQGWITNPGQAFAAMRSQNSNSGWVVEELVPIDPLECNGPSIVWDGFHMSVKATGSGENTTIAVGYPGENDGRGAVEIFRRENGQWVNCATLLDPAGAGGDFLGRHLGLITRVDGDLLLVTSKYNTETSRKCTSSDGGVTWQWQNSGWANLDYGRVFDLVSQPPRDLVVTPEKIIQVEYGFGDIDVFGYDSGLDFVNIVNAVIGPGGTIFIGLGSNFNATSPIKLFQVRPGVPFGDCIREVSVSIANLTATDGLGTAVAVGLKGTVPVLLAGGSMAEGMNNGMPVVCGKAVMTLPTPPLAPPLPGDINGDGQVGVDDVLIVLDSWGSCHGKCLADFNGDGVVAIEDLLVVLRYWTQ